MITLKLKSLAVKDNDIQGAIIVCPHCLEDTYAFYKVCLECGADLFEANALVGDGHVSRFIYYKLGWPAMDQMAMDRFNELRETVR